jgi:hypothetical protein
MPTVRARTFAMGARGRARAVGDRRATQRMLSRQDRRPPGQRGRPPVPAPPQPPAPGGAQAGG